MRAESALIKYEYVLPRVSAIVVTTVPSSLLGISIAVDCVFRIKHTPWLSNALEQGGVGVTAAY